MLAGYIKHLIETANVIQGMRFTRESDRTSITWEEFLASVGMKRMQDGRCVRIDAADQAEETPEMTQKTRCEVPLERTP